MNLSCPHCTATVPEASVDRTRDIATCGGCGLLIDLRAVPEPPQDAATSTTSARPARPPVELPPGMRMFQGTDGRVSVSGAEGFTIVRRWLRRKHFVFLLVFVGLSVFAALEWTNKGASTPLVIGTILVVLWNLNVLKMFVNSTTVRVGGGRIDVRHTPIPSIGFKNREVAAEQIAQLFARNRGKLFEVAAQMKDGTTITLVSPLVSADQAVFIEQQIEGALGIEDYAVSGELGNVSGTPVPAGRFAGVMAIVPLVGISAGVFMATSMATKVEGELTFDDDSLGSFTYVSDRCRSGQLRGFFGVELTSETQTGTVVRLIRDPATGPVLVVDQGAGLTRFTPETCDALVINVEQTNSSVNDVWVVRGSASIACPGVVGDLTFSNCH